MYYRGEVKMLGDNLKKGFFLLVLFFIMIIIIQDRKFSFIGVVF